MERGISLHQPLLVFDGLSKGYSQEMRFIVGTIRWAVSLVFLLLLLALALTLITPIWWDLEFRSVASGSMEPAIPLGAVAIVVPVDATAVQVGDVITFRSPENPSLVVTHRVVEVNGSPDARLYRTKGDANDDEDLEPVPAESILGQVRLHIPYLGYLAQYIRTRQGWIYLVLVPGGALVLMELVRILKVIWTSDGKHARDSEAAEGSG